jgi:hypothetical protein
MIATRLRFFKQFCTIKLVTYWTTNIVRGVARVGLSCMAVIGTTKMSV